MNKVDFKKPRYVIPLICLPFILLLFYVYRSISSLQKDSGPPEAELQTGISGVSSEVSGKGIEDKLEAFKQRYKKGDGYTALETIELDKSEEETTSAYNSKEKRMLDSIGAALKSRRNASLAHGANLSAARASYLDRNPRMQNRSSNQKELEEILSAYYRSVKKAPEKPADPMALFRAQMAIVDSMNKASLAPIKSPVKPKTGMDNRPLKEDPPPLQARKQQYLPADSLTLFAPMESPELMQAMIEQSLTGFNGSRVGIRLLEDIRIGGQLIKKGTLIYALITGFSAQRVMMSITSIANRGAVLPVKLEIYDLDGIKGIYVPASAYREFSRELASSSVSGITMESSIDQNQQLMSLLGRMFQSTTGAVNRLIRSNKATIRYPSMVYLIDASITKK
ncbi:conjugative transposon protein TraM [Pedobacter agri]|uniref:conjugative transposon protein TraM n=1 Tax=Pedobacter agri TaxID=454586 RepID=UPI00292D836D|nr:conjugative transposon protein TraM [Pedobacter agri]